MSAIREQDSLRLLVSGSRSLRGLQNVELDVFDALDERCSEINGRVEILRIRGDGVDKMVRKWCKSWCKSHPIVSQRIFMPISKGNRSATQQAHRRALEACEEVLVFWDGRSTGTKNLMELCGNKLGGCHEYDLGGM